MAVKPPIIFGEAFRKEEPRPREMAVFTGGDPVHSVFLVARRHASSLSGTQRKAKGRQFCKRAGSAPMLGRSLGVFRPLSLRCISRTQSSLVAETVAHGLPQAVASAPAIRSGNGWNISARQVQSAGLGAEILDASKPCHNDFDAWVTFNERPPAAAAASEPAWQADRLSYP